MYKTSIFLLDISLKSLYKYKNKTNLYAMIIFNGHVTQRIECQIPILMVEGSSPSLLMVYKYYFIKFIISI